VGAAPRLAQAPLSLRVGAAWLELRDLAGLSAASVAHRTRWQTPLTSLREAFEERAWALSEQWERAWERGGGGL